MRVLIACEFSAIVRNAFIKRGHHAISCDLLPTEGDSPYHIQGDVLQHLNEQWDMMIAHPPCTFLCNSGVSWLHKDPKRWDKMEEAKEFFSILLDEAPIEKICVENPIPHKYAKEGVYGIGRYDQIIQPYEFGHAERKATCLWLKNLPKLKPTNNVKDEMEKLPKNIAQKIHYTSPGPNRWRERSRTFQGIADAMAEQWGGHNSECLCDHCIWEKACPL